jgi:DNA primase
MEINQIKQRLSIITTLAKYGLTPDRNSQVKCPFHDDGTASMKIYPATNTYHCFACGKTGDQIQFIQDKEGITKHEAILKAETMITNQPEPEPRTLKNTQPTTEPNYPELFTCFLQSIERSQNAHNYCQQRGLDYKTLEIGYNSREKWNKLVQCLIFPLKDRNNNIVSLYGRRISESKGHALEFGRHYYSERRSGLYPNYPKENTQTLIITEAIIDAATLLQVPEITSQFVILAAYGTNGITYEHKQAIKELKHLQEIIFFFDGDTAGREAAIKNAEELQKLLPQVTITSIETPQDEDVNSLYVKYGKECLMQLINERKPVNELSFSIESNLIEPQDNKPSQSFSNPQISTLAHYQISPLNTENPHKITFETLTARYIVKGGLPRQLDKMLVSLDVQHLETAIKYRTRLDLYEEKQTRKEAREAAEKLDLRSDLIETDLSKLCDLLEEEREKELKIKNEELKMGETLVPLAEQAKCKEFLSKPGLIKRINELIGKSGITGEENNRLFLFIIATSYKMPDTLHALIQGSSGSGKTHLLGKIADLMPQERVERFTRITDNSLYNYGEYELMHHLLCLEDVDGLKEEALFAWRELISNNMLRSSTSQKDDNGNSRGAKRIVRGPMASMCATTHGHIYEDNMSRLFIIAVDESPEQTARIIEYQSKLAAGTIKKEEETQAKEFLQNCVRMLKPYKVVNPYADKIKLPQQAHKIRRLHELFLCFVKQVTLLNQYQRKRDQQGRIITEKDDLETAVEIMFESIFLKVDELDGSLRQFFESLKTYLEEKPNAQAYEFTQREIRHALHVSKTQLHRYINELIELEYIQQNGGYANKGFKYKISYWDNIQKLRNEIQTYLQNQIRGLVSQTDGTPDGTLQSPSNL